MADRLNHLEALLFGDVNPYSAIIAEVNPHISHLLYALIISHLEGFVKYYFYILLQ